MLKFGLHTAKTAPQGSKEYLRRAESSFGFLPSLFAGLAASSAALGGYAELRARFGRSSLNAVEQEVVALATAVAHGSNVSASTHAYTARHFTAIPRACLYALLEGRKLPDPRLNVLADFARDVVRQRGRMDRGDLHVMLAAGYGLEQMLDVVMGVVLVTFESYISHMVQPPLNVELSGEHAAIGARPQH
jgi:alkylhydroperoxidase family enzyme